MSCMLCNQEKRIYKRHYEGGVCKDCFGRLPTLFGWRRLSGEQIRWLYQNSLKYSFEETAKLGKLSLDEPKGLIAVQKGFDRGHCKNVFSILDMTEISIHPTHLKQSDTGREVYCDVELCFSLKCNLRYKGIIKGKEKCNVSPVLYDGKLEVREPLTVSMMRSMMQQAIENQFSNAKVLLEKFSELEARKEELLAMGTLMLSENYTKEELKQHRNSLIKAFHPDNYKDDNAGVYTDKINQAYQILKKK